MTRLWATVAFVLAPIAAVLGLLYIARTFPLQTKPARHGVTLAAIFISLAFSLAWVGGVLSWAAALW